MAAAEGDGGFTMLGGGGIDIVVALARKQTAKRSRALEVMEHNILLVKSNSQEHSALAHCEVCVRATKCERHARVARFKSLTL